MSKHKNNTETYEYELRDIVNFKSTDPKGVVDDKVYKLSEAIADELNYARALNNNPLRLFKIEAPLYDTFLLGTYVCDCSEKTSCN